MVQFMNAATEYTAGGELTALTWLDARGFTVHEFGDAMIAVGGGDDHAVQVISVSDGRVVRLLKVGPDRYCSPHHPTHFALLFLEFISIL